MREKIINAAIRASLIWAMLSFARAWFVGGWWFAASIAIAIVWCLLQLHFRRRYDVIAPIVGGSLNLCAMIANHGQMPVTAAFTDGMTASHATMTAASRLPFLCDLYPIGSVGYFSFGDAVIFIGWPALSVLLWALRKRPVAECNPFYLEEV